jgi:Ni,Fe-hydrogenase I cytochrome b subunit
MFESLDEHMKLDDQKEVSSSVRMLRWSLGIVVSILVFGGLYLGVHLLQG